MGTMGIVEYNNWQILEHNVLKPIMQEVIRALGL